MELEASGMALSARKQATNRLSKKQQEIMAHPDYELRVAVGTRLRAVMREFGYDQHEVIGEVSGVSPGSINNWVNQGSLPRVPTMIPLCEETGITLDWIYRGVSQGMDGRLAVRLEDRIKNNDIKQKVIRRR